MSFQYICGCCRMLRIYALTNEVSPLWFPVVQLGTTDSLKLGMLMEHERWAGSSDHLSVCITFSSKGTNKGPCDFMLSSYSLVKTALFPLPNISFVTPKHWPVWTILFIPPTSCPMTSSTVYLTSWSSLPFASCREVMQACLRGHYTITRQAPRCLFSLWWQSWYSFYPQCTKVLWPLRNKRNTIREVLYDWAFKVTAYL